MHADEEAEPAALTFLARGYHAFILYYSLKQESGYPNTLLEAAEAVKTVRENASEWGIDPKQIYMMGFSAGAHTTAMLASQWKSSGVAETLGCRPEMIKPDKAVLCYGVMRLNPPDEQALKDPELPSIKKGDYSSTDVIQSISRDTVPLFLWH